MTKTLHLFLASDCYLLHLSLCKTLFTLTMDFCFVFRDQSYERVCRYRHSVLKASSQVTSERLYKDHQAEISLIQDYGMRLVGHIHEFDKGQNMLVDIMLKPRGKQGALELYTADGSMLIDDTEYLFAPAHSAATMFSSAEQQHNAWLSPISYRSIPAVIVLKPAVKRANCAVISAKGIVAEQDTCFMWKDEKAQCEETENLIILRSPVHERIRTLCLADGQIHTKQDSTVSIKDRWFYRI